MIINPGTAECGGTSSGTWYNGFLQLQGSWATSRRKPTQTSVCTQLSQAGGWHPSHLTTSIFFFPELLCLTLGKEEGKQIHFLLSKHPHNSDTRKSQNFTFNICCQTTLMLQHLQPDIAGTLLGIPVRSQCSLCCADRQHCTLKFCCCYDQHRESRGESVTHLLRHQTPTQMEPTWNLQILMKHSRPMPPPLG